MKVRRSELAMLEKKKKKKEAKTCDQVTLVWYIQWWRAVFERVLRQQ